MLSKVAKFLLVSTSLAPVLLTMWFISFHREWNICDGWPYLLIAALLVFVCFLILRFSKKEIASISIEIKEVQTADKEIVGFFLTYLVPLITSPLNFGWEVALFVGLLMFLVIFNSHTYHFNPLLGLLGYHFYEVKTVSGITYVLMTRMKINDCKDVKKVIQLTEYIVMEADDA